MEQLPRFAAWRFVDAVDGFEVVYTAPGELRGHTSAVENGKPYAVHHDIRFDEEWRTREVVVSADTVAGALQVKLTSDGAGSWTVNDQPRPDLDGLVDIDLEASACTKTFPVHRLHLAAVETVRAPAVYVEALDLTVRRLDQTYRRLDSDAAHPSGSWCGPGFEAQAVSIWKMRPAMTRLTSHLGGLQSRSE